MGALQSALLDPLYGGRASLAAFMGDKPPRFGVNFLTPGFDARATFARATNAWGVGPSSLIGQSAPGVPRIVFDPAATLRPLGYLAEIQSQQTLTQGRTLSDWNGTAATIAANDATAPDGTATAIRVTETAATATVHRVSPPGITVTGDTLYSFSIFVKAGTRTRVGIALDGASAWAGGSSSNRINVQLDTGAVTLIGNVSAGGAIPYGGGWYRVWVSVVSAGSPSGQSARLYILDDTGGLSYDGDTGKYVWAWGGQFEAGPLTSFIPSAGSTVTRAADVAYFDNIDAWFNSGSGGGTVLSEAYWSAVPPTGGHYLWSLADNFGTELIGIYKAVSGSETAATTISAGVTTALNMGTKAVTAGKVYRHVLSWDGNGGFWDAANGVAGTPVSGIAMPTSIKKLSIGCLHTGSNVLNGIMRRWDYLPYSIPLAECRGLSVV